MQLKKLLGYVLKPYIKSLSKSAFPVVDGEIPVLGITETTKIRRDQRGIAYVQASNEKDMFFAQGFAHAQDRLWQMELNRRVATGRLSEFFGNLSVDTDKFARNLGFSRLGLKDYKEMGENEKQMIESYVNGINAYLTSEIFKMPPEYKLTKTKPNPWTIEDVMAFTRFMIWQLSHAWYGKIIRMHLINELDRSLVDELEVNVPKENSTILPKGIETYRFVEKVLEPFQGPFLNNIAASNSVVVSGELTETGTPYLLNDVHLPLSAPQLWYEMVIETEEFHAAGVSIPGIPSILIGQNKHIAWGITLAMTDAADVYIELIDWNKEEYLFNGEMRKLEKITETIEIIEGKSKRTEKMDIYYTHRGPILFPEILDENELPIPNAGEVEKLGLSLPDNKNLSFALSVRDYALDSCKAISGWYKLDKSKDWNDFVEAMRLIEAPQLNISYVDNQNIGYWCTGKLPKRENPGREYYPYPGWTDEFDWKEDIPFEEMPHALNPEKKFIVTANNKVTGDNYKHYLGNSWMNGYRAKRITDLINSATKDGKLGRNDLNKFMMDVYCIPAKEFSELIGNISKSLWLTENEKVIIEILEKWDGYMKSDRIEPTVYEVLRYKMIFELFTTSIPEKRILQLMGFGPHPVLLPTNEIFGHDTVVLLRILKNPNSPWWQRYAEAKGTTKEKAQGILLKNSLKTTINWLRKHLGIKPEDWRYGRIHKAVFPHSLSLEPMLEPVLNPKSRPISGNTDTPYQTAFLPNQPFDNNAWSISFRLNVDGASLSDSMFATSLGQSGIPFNPHYSDLTDEWIAGKYHKYEWITDKEHEILELTQKEK